MAGVFDLSEAEITQAFSAMVQGSLAVSVFEDDAEIDVNVLLGGPHIGDPFDLETIFLRFPTVPLYLCLPLPPWNPWSASPCPKA